jgi:ABC-type sulfate transport system permease component
MHLRPESLESLSRFPWVLCVCVAHSPHSVTGLIGLLLLGTQGMLSLLFEDEPGLRTVHTYFGVTILAFFFIHLALGLNLGLSI